MPPSASSPARHLDRDGGPGPGGGSHTDPVLLEALADPAVYGVDGPVAVHETHASWVFLAGERAYKVKKPVRLAFLDYSTLARRHAACREEVRVNRDLAPDFYLGVRAIIRTAWGFRFSAEDTPGAVEYVVLMRRFDETHTLRRSRLPILSSDAIRKRRAGLAATDRAKAEHYTEAFTRATYELLGEGALARLDRRGGVIVDATCHTKSDRASLFHRLHRADVTFLVVHCRVTLETALARARARMQSPQRVSDATPQIVARQFHRFQPLDELPARSVLTLDGEESVDSQVAEVTRAVDERLWAPGDQRSASSPAQCFPRVGRGVSHLVTAPAGA